MEENNMLEQLKALLKRKKGKAYYASKLNISEKQVEELMKEAKGEFLKDLDGKATVVYNENGYYEWKYLAEEGGIDATVTANRALSIEELVEFHKIDINKYKIGNYWSIYKNGKFHSSVHASLKKPQDYSPEDFAKFLETYNPVFPKHSCKCKQTGKQEVDVELSIADFHLAKKTIDGNNSIASRKDTFMQAVDYLLSQVSHFNIKTIVFPISNDFFHTDNYQNSTTNLTPQDTITSFDNEYEEGFDLLVTAIDVLSQHAENVDVILVQGNHDRTKSFYLAHALEVFFKNYPSISFQRNHSVTKSIVLGNTFIGYHHGNCKIDDLPLIFATGKDTSFNFGLAKYREVHTGDKHHYMTKEIKGVRIMQSPSLSGTDRWHLDNNYVNSIRAAIINVYHPQHGKIAESEYRI